MRVRTPRTLIDALERWDERRPASCWSVSRLLGSDAPLLCRAWIPIASSQKPAPQSRVAELTRERNAMFGLRSC
jgi:hypothetical protein